MRRARKVAKLVLAEGLSQMGSPRCVITALTMSNLGQRKLVTGLSRATLVRSRADGVVLARAGEEAISWLVSMAWESNRTLHRHLSPNQQRPAVSPPRRA